MSALYEFIGVFVIIVGGIFLLGWIILVIIRWKEGWKNPIFGIHFGEEEDIILKIQEHEREIKRLQDVFIDMHEKANPPNDKNKKS